MTSLPPSFPAASRKPVAASSTAPPALRLSELDCGDILQVLAALQGAGVLAVVTRVEGPSYRPQGAMMLFAWPDALQGKHHARRVGSLSSGCIEADLETHAARALGIGRPVTLLYGKGSPFFDIRLPCGGGLEILLIPRPDPELLGQAITAQAARQPYRLGFDPKAGLVHLDQGTTTGWHAGIFHAAIRPEPRFLVFGKGPEAEVFASLALSAHYPVLLASHDPETLARAVAMNIPTRRIGATLPDLGVDRWTAAVLFYHDHDREPALLRQLLATPAFYIGAQGSQRARATRDGDLRAIGVGEGEIARIRGPIGLIPSTRDPRLLAISVLAEILSLS